MHIHESHKTTKMKNFLIPKDNYYKIGINKLLKIWNPS